MKTIQKIVTLIPSDRWRSSVQFHLTQVLPQAKISAVLDFEDGLVEVAQRQPVAAIIELDSNLAQAFCATLGHRLCEFPSTIFVAVGDPDLLPWLSLLRICGFADVCCNLAGIATMCERIKRHADWVRVQQSEVKLESAILDQLPWKPIRSDENSARLHTKQEQK